MSPLTKQPFHARDGAHRRGPRRARGRASLRRPRSGSAIRDRLRGSSRIHAAPRVRRASRTPTRLPGEVRRSARREQPSPAKQECARCVRQVLDTPSRRIASTIDRRRQRKPARPVPAARSSSRHDFCAQALRFAPTPTYDDRSAARTSASRHGRQANQAPRASARTKAARPRSPRTPRLCNPILPVRREGRCCSIVRRHVEARASCRAPVRARSAERARRVDLRQRVRGRVHRRSDSASATWHHRRTQRGRAGSVPQSLRALTACATPARHDSLRSDRP